MILSELAQKTAGRVIGKETLEVKSVSEIADAQAGGLVFISDAKKLETAINSSADIIVCSERTTLPEVSLKNFLLVKDVRLAMAQILACFEKVVEFTPKINPSAVISKSAKLGKNVQIGPFCSIGEEVEIGDDTIVYSNVSIYAHTKIGSKCILHSGVVLGADGFGFTRDKQEVVKIPQIGRVVLGDNVEIGASSTVDRATMGETVIGSGTKIDDQVQIGHNTKIGKNCLIAASTAIAGSCVLENGVTTGGLVGIVDHMHIGENAIIAGRSMVTKDVPANTVVSGTPAQEHRAEMKFWARLRRMVDQA
ncbi:MAG: UDP-3-O-(3-hydroxymyristoyl)glucosamine N-acyltransferase [Candidatus Margulisiibacteriota bacterium]|jgi:UDP-3-O-[3-hydroxymyristoyl] glucosamine N-acyltransferase